MCRPSNVLLADDAGSFIDPITDEGIYCAAEAVAYALECNDESSALPCYEQLWRGEFSARYISPVTVMSIPNSLVHSPLLRTA